jgi:hypothetical protein
MRAAAATLRRRLAHDDATIRDTALGIARLEKTAAELVANSKECATMAQRLTELRSEIDVIVNDGKKMWAAQQARANGAESK